MKGQYFFFLLKTFIYYLIDLHLCKKNWHEIGISNVFAFGMIEYETLFDDTQTYSSSLILRNYFVILECHWKWIFFFWRKRRNSRNILPNRIFVGKFSLKCTNISCWSNRIVFGIESIWFGWKFLIHEFIFENVHELIHIKKKIELKYSMRKIQVNGNIEIWNKNQQKLFFPIILHFNMFRK